MKPTLLKNILVTVALGLCLAKPATAKTNGLSHPAASAQGYLAVYLSSVASSENSAWYFPRSFYSIYTGDGKSFRTITSQPSADEIIPDVVAFPSAPTSSLGNRRTTRKSACRSSSGLVSGPLSTWICARECQRTSNRHPSKPKLRLRKATTMVSPYERSVPKWRSTLPRYLNQPALAVIMLITVALLPTVGSKESRKPSLSGRATGETAVQGKDRTPCPRAIPSVSPDRSRSLTVSSFITRSRRSR